MADETKDNPQGVHQQILDQFLKELKSGDVSASVIERLRIAVASEEISDTGLKKAMFTDDTEV